MLKYVDEEGLCKWSTAAHDHVLRGQGWRYCAAEVMRGAQQAIVEKRQALVGKKATIGACPKIQAEPSPKTSTNPQV